MEKYKENLQLERSIPDEELFGYLQRDTLNLIALVILAVSWLGAFIFYSPVDRQILVTWLPAVGVIWLGCSLALALNQRHFRLAVVVLSTSLLVADGLALVVFQNGQLLYFAVPVISLANYLIGPLVAGAVFAGIVLLAGLGVSNGIPPLELAGPLVLAVMTATLKAVLTLPPLDPAMGLDQSPSLPGKGGRVSAPPSRAGTHQSVSGGGALPSRPAQRGPCGSVESGRRSEKV